MQTFASIQVDGNATRSNVSVLRGVRDVAEDGACGQRVAELEFCHVVYRLWALGVMVRCGRVLRREWMIVVFGEKLYLLIRRR